MTAKEASAEIVDLQRARAPSRPGELDPGSFLGVGAYLEAVRVASDQSIDAVVTVTHIKPQFIEAIEAMDLDRLPAKPFAVGFVRSYAEFLELNVDAIVDRFKQEAGYETVGAPVESEEPVEETPEEIAGERADLSLLSVVALLAFMIWCATWLTRPSDPQAPLRMDGLQTPSSLGIARRPVERSDSAAQGLPVIVEPTIAESVEPVYPMRCLVGAQAIETVEVAFTITVDGRVVSERVVNASNDCFRRSAINSMRQWRFKPLTVDGAARPAFDRIRTFSFAKPA